MISGGYEVEVDGKVYHSGCVPQEEEIMARQLTEGGDETDQLVGRHYGKEMLLDLHDCDAARFTREHLEEFFVGLCLDVLKMDRHDLHFWDDEGVPPDEMQTDPKTVGITAVQFIMFSNVTVHCLTLLRQVFINIFSCKDFDAQDAFKFCKEFFGAVRWRMRVVHRG